MIHTYESVKTLQDGGFTDKQAESLVKVLKNFITREEFKSEFSRFEEDIRKDMKELELRLTIKISGIVFMLMLSFKIIEKFI